jgi:glycosyltransferase involved in cell wall biosynthesis
MHRPSVTIGITTYNRAHLVTHAIDSVLAQDYTPLEVVVVDDGSTDATLEVLRRYQHDPRVRVIALPKNGGIPVAKNAALDAITGEYGALLDSDDLLLPGAIDTCVRAFAQHGDAVSQVYGDCLDSVTGGVTGSGMPGAGLVTYERALCDGFRGEFWQLFRTRDLGALRFHPEALTSESLVWHAMFRKKPGYYLAVPLRRYVREGTDRISTARPTPRVAHGRMMAYHAYLEVFGEEVQRLCPRRYAELSGELAKWQARCHRRGAAMKTLIRMIRAGGVRAALPTAAVVLMPARLHDTAYRLKALIEGQRRTS